MTVTHQLLMKKVLLAAHARGLVFREVPIMVVRMAVDPTNTLASMANALSQEGSNSTLGKRLKYAISVRLMFDEIVSKGMCDTEALEDDFPETAFLNGGFRDDAMVVLAFSLDTAGRAYELVGAATWGSADERGTNDEKLDFQDAELLADVKAGRIAEVDLICSKPSKAQAVKEVKTKRKQSKSQKTKDHCELKGFGSLILGYTLAKIAAKKQRGTNKYKGVVMNLAYSGTPEEKKATLAGIAQRFGFRAAPIMKTVVLNRQEKIVEDMQLNYVETSGPLWMSRVFAAVPEGDRHFQNLCPLVTGTGKTMCQGGGR